MTGGLVRALLAAAALAWPSLSAAQVPAAVPAEESGEHDHDMPGMMAASPEEPAGEDADQAAVPGFIPPVTDDMRRAAFPDVSGHAMEDSAIHVFVLGDQLEWQSADGGAAAAWDARGWIGGDRDRLWFRTEGEAEEGHVGQAEAHVLYGRAIARWWDLVLGVRQDVRPGPARSWAAVGLQGLAPYWFEVELTGYVGSGGRTMVRAEVEYELLITNRLVAQPLVEVEAHGKADPPRRIGAGLSTVETGLRLRYEVRREFAPYLGVTWERRLLGTADAARDVGEPVGSARVVAGVRLWY